MHVIFSCESILRSQGISLQTVVRKYLRLHLTCTFLCLFKKSDRCGCIVISQVNQLRTEREFSCSVHFNSTAWTRSLISTVTRLLQQHRVCQANYWPPSFLLKHVYVFSCIQYHLNPSQIKYLWTDWTGWFSLWMTWQNSLLSVTFYTCICGACGYRYKEKAVGPSADRTTRQSESIWDWTVEFANYFIYPLLPAGVAVSPSPNGWVELPQSHLGHLNKPLRDLKKDKR